MTHTAVSPVLSPAQAAEFQREGFVRVPEAIPTSSIRDARAKLAAIFETRPDTSIGDVNGVRGDIIARHQWLADLFLNERVIGSLKSLLGDDFVMLPETSITDSQFGGWHTDITSAELLGETFRTDPGFKVVNAAIYFQENGRFGGGLDVVPGSHLKPDVFVAEVKAKYDAHEKTKGKKSVKGMIYGVLSAVLPKSLLEFRRKHLKTSTQPLQHESNQPGQYTISQQPGDLVVFDLRLSHKATWPQTHDYPPPEARKFSFFAICGANNETTRKYCNYLKKRAETQAAYAYLKNHKYPAWLLDRARAAGVTLL